MVQIIWRAGELEVRRVEHPHLVERRPQLTGPLDIGDIGNVRDFIEPACHVLARRAQRGGGDEQQKDKSTEPPTGGERNRPRLHRRRVVLIERGHHVILGITSYAIPTYCRRSRLKKADKRKP